MQKGGYRLGFAANGKKNRFMGTVFTYEDLRPENTAVNTYTLAASEAELTRGGS